MKEKTYIERIIKYCTIVDEYMNGINTIEELQNNQMVADAVLLNLQNIGETVKKISDEVKERNSDISWQGATGLRDIIAHEYEGIKYDIIFDVCTNDLSTLSSQLEEINDSL